MKNLFTAVILGIAFAGASLAQTSSEEKGKVKVAVIEFTIELLTFSWLHKSGYQMRYRTEIYLVRVVSVQLGEKVRTPFSAIDRVKALP